QLPHWPVPLHWLSCPSQGSPAGASFAMHAPSSHVYCRQIVFSPQSAFSIHDTHVPVSVHRPPAPQALPVRGSVTGVAPSQRVVVHAFPSWTTSSTSICSMMLPPSPHTISLQSPIVCGGMVPGGSGG